MKIFLILAFQDGLQKAYVASEDRLRKTSLLFFRAVLKALWRMVIFLKTILFIFSAPHKQAFITDFPTEMC